MLTGSLYYYPHYTDGETQAQGVKWLSPGHMASEKCHGDPSPVCFVVSTVVMTTSKTWAPVLARTLNRQLLTNLLDKARSWFPSLFVPPSLEAVHKKENTFVPVFSKYIRHYEI